VNRHDLIRLGDKVVSRRKIEKFVEKMLALRSEGLSQTEVAGRLGVDRTLVNRLENLGEVRKGATLAVVGFPVLNKAELEEALEREGVDFIFLMTQEERWNFVRQKSGVDLLNAVMDLIAKAHSFDHIVIIGSTQRIKIFEAVLDREVIGFEIGESPIVEDKYVKVEEVVRIVQAIKG